MAKTYYCWRCQIEVPMLEEDEWSAIAPWRHAATQEMTELRIREGLSLHEAVERAGQLACAKYEELTGFRETNPLAILHHRLCLWGPECPSCGQLFRTPAASYCANCGESRTGG